LQLDRDLRDGLEKSVAVTAFLEMTGEVAIERLPKSLRGDPADRFASDDGEPPGRSTRISRRPWDAPLGEFPFAKEQFRAKAGSPSAGRRSPDRAEYRRAARRSEPGSTCSRSIAVKKGVGGSAQFSRRLRPLGQHRRDGARAASTSVSTCAAVITRAARRRGCRACPGEDAAGSRPSAPCR